MEANLLAKTEQEARTRPRRKRTGRKRTVFSVPHFFPAPVRQLWRSAEKEEQQRAHRTCVSILEYWLGKKSKSEVAAELSLPVLRVWQLSQAALSGMLAGLLKQPRARRGRARTWAGAPEDDPKQLKREVLKLKTELSRTEDLVRVLRTAPWLPENEAVGAELSLRLKPKGAQHAAKNAAKKAAKTGAKQRAKRNGQSVERVRQSRVERTRTGAHQRDPAAEQPADPRR